MRRDIEKTGREENGNPMTPPSAEPEKCPTCGSDKPISWTLPRGYCEDLWHESNRRHNAAHSIPAAPAETLGAAHPPTHAEPEHILRNLLAVVHRDGGHYADEHGLLKAGEDSEKVVIELRSPRADTDERAEQWIEDGIYTLALEDLLIQLEPHAPAHESVKLGCMGPRICSNPCLRCQIEQVTRKIRQARASLERRK